MVVDQLLQGTRAGGCRRKHGATGTVAAGFVEGRGRPVVGRDVLLRNRVHATQRRVRIGRRLPADRWRVRAGRPRVTPRRTSTTPTRAAAKSTSRRCGGRVPARRRAARPSRAELNRLRRGALPQALLLRSRSHVVHPQRRAMSAEEKNAVAERMTAYWAERRKKAAK